MRVIPAKNCVAMHDTNCIFYVLRYCWLSPRLVEDKSYQWLVRPNPKLYIPLEIPESQDWSEAEWRERLIVGHSVGFDRSFIKEQYYIKVHFFLVSMCCSDSTHTIHVGF